MKGYELYRQGHHWTFTNLTNNTIVTRFLTLFGLFFANYAHFQIIIISNYKIHSFISVCSISNDVRHNA